MDTSPKNIIFVKMIKKMLLYLVVAQMLSVTVCKCSIINEIIKISALIEHYHQHTEDNQDMTFFAFFDMHYLQETVHDADYEEDMKLPFKAEHKLLQHVQLNLILPSVVRILPSFIAHTTFISIPDVSARAVNIVDAIWQPPKFL